MYPWQHVLFSRRDSLARRFGSRKNIATCLASYIIFLTENSASFFLLRDWSLFGKCLLARRLLVVLYGVFSQAQTNTEWDVHLQAHLQELMVNLSDDCAVQCYSNAVSEVGSLQAAPAGDDEAASGLSDCITVLNNANITNAAVQVRQTRVCAESANR